MKNNFINLKIDKSINNGESFIAIKKEEIISIHIYDVEKINKIECLTVYFMFKRYDQSIMIKISPNIINVENLRNIIFESLTIEKESSIDFTKENQSKIISLTKKPTD